MSASDSVNDPTPPGFAREALLVSADTGWQIDEGEGPVHTPIPRFRPANIHRTVVPQELCRRYRMRQTISVCFMLSLVVLASVSGCTGSVVGSGKLETRDFSLSGFTNVEAAADFEVVITESTGHSVSVTADNNLFEYLDIKTSGSTLYLGPKPGVSLLHGTLKAAIGLPQLDGLELSGASDGRVTGFTSTRPLTVALSGASSAAFDDASAGETKLSLSGASDLSGKLTGTDVTIDLSGSSAISLMGSATTMTATGSGASTLALEEFIAENADIRLDGASNAHVHVTGDLRVELSGDSHVSYEGNPTLTGVKLSGSSSVEEM
ncbi:MAG: DUF2807 domain-containing protein [Dehalococcoidia bacterium]|nr:MAG: DUF2807 domain-containing protein [Dehalococcoidia bacterium]